MLSRDCAVLYLNGRVCVCVRTGMGECVRVCVCVGVWVCGHVPEWNVVREWEGVCVHVPEWMCACLCVRASTWIEVCVCTYLNEYVC